MNWLLLQLADSAFPVGSFAHSSGVEAAAQHGLFHNEPIADFIRALLHQTVKGALPILFAAHREPAYFAETDDFCDAFLSNHVTNRASRAQGAATLAAARRIFAPPSLDALHQQIRVEKLNGHLAPIFGATMRSLDIDEEACGQLFLFITLRGAISSAVRLGVVGPLEAQRIQAGLSDEAAALVAPARAVPMENAAQTSPFLDMLQGNQDRLYSRLFQS